ncbi:MAG: thioredoxin family protein [Alphaproteobacteria bacterium]|nr:thioredoxin family protein [Alphaproteobacteria bacterium]
MTRTASAVALTALLATAAWAGSLEDPQHRAIRQAVSDDPGEQVAGIRALRAAGEPGLDALIAARDAGRIRATDHQWSHAIDQVAAQRDASWSELFWHTDLEAAKAQARAEGKPILSLRMLGDLREATSCANSRFFRTVLYASPEVAARMDDGFVLHWSSEREVPQITIRYGDGRELHSTITGNSAHYVLDAEGRPLDVIPGLLTPEAFLDELGWAHDLHAAIEASPEERATLLASRHAARRDEAILAVQFAKQNPDPTNTVLFASMIGDPVEPRHADDAVPALMAIPIAIGKGRVEQPFAQFTFGGGTIGETFGIEDLVVTDTGTLHPRSVALIRSQQPSGPEADPATVDALIAKFTRTVQEDSTWNRHVLHARIHQWFATGWTADFEGLNQRLYAEIFATPASDPWLGLFDPTVYTGIQGAGIVSNGVRAH